MSALIKISSGLPTSNKKRGRHNPMSQEEKDLIALLKSQNLSDRDVAEITNRSPYSVSRVMRKRRQAVVREGYFDVDSFSF